LLDAPDGAGGIGEPYARPAQYVFAPEVVLCCRDVNFTVSFYEQVLGLRVFEDGRPRQPQVRLEGYLTFVPAESKSDMDQTGLEIRLRARGLRALARGIGQVGGDASWRERENGPAELVLHDPDGRRVVLIEVP